MYHACGKQKGCASFSSHVTEINLLYTLTLTQGGSGYCYNELLFRLVQRVNHTVCMMQKVTHNSMNRLASMYVVHGTASILTTAKKGDNKSLVIST